MTITTTPTRITSADELPAPTPAIPTQTAPVEAFDVEAALDDIADGLARLAGSTEAFEAAVDAVFEATPDDDHLSASEAVGSWLGMRETDWATQTAAERAGYRTATLVLRDGRRFGGCSFFVDYGYTGAVTA